MENINFDKALVYGARVFALVCSVLMLTAILAVVRLSF
jgi:hypothetical protein